MYRLRDLKNGMMQIHIKNGPAFEGTQPLIIAKCIEIGIDPSELEIAVDEMEKNNHDYADFGILGRFILTGADRKAA